MSSEILRDRPGVAPVFWRVVNGAVAAREEEEQEDVAQQLELRFQEGQQQGIAEALGMAREEAQSHLAPILERLARSIDDLAQARQSVRDETAADLVRLSIAIASRILHREITIDPDAIHGLLEAAFAKTRSREVTRVVVHPAHEASVRSFLEQSPGSAPLEIVCDPRLECGAIHLETAVGQLDASLETQLKEIERGLADRIDQ